MRNKRGVPKPIQASSLPRTRLFTPVGARKFSDQNGKDIQNFYEPSKKHRLFNFFDKNDNDTVQVENPYTEEIIAEASFMTKEEIK